MSNIATRTSGFATTSPENWAEFTGDPGGKAEFLEVLLMSPRRTSTEHRPRLLRHPQRTPLGLAIQQAIVREIIDGLNTKVAKEHGPHTVYIMQQGIEYLYNYADAAHAQADFTHGVRNPASRSTQTQRRVATEGRLALTEEQIKAWQETSAKEEDFEDREKENDSGWFGYSRVRNIRGDRMSDR